MDVDAAAARAHRSRLATVTFVGITGSCGKTTTKDLAAGMLLPARRGAVSAGSGNCGADLVRHVLQVEPAHDFCLQELGAWGPGTLDAGLAVLQPTIGVVLNVRRDHYSRFQGLHRTAAEKSKVVGCLPPGGTAILNADDPYVAAMRAVTRAHVLTFGTHLEADLRASEVRSEWPDCLRFTLHAGGAPIPVQTRLHGEHLVGSALAAVAIAHALGVPLQAAVDRLADLPPVPRRMSAQVTGSGVEVVRDDFKAASDSLDELLRFLAAARASRKVLVVGRISDHPGRSRSIYTAFGRAAAAVADLLVFVGERPEELWGGDDRRSAAHPLEEFAGARARAAVFGTVRDASRFLGGELRRGDLLVLKGSGASDHLERIVLERDAPVQCWRAHCGLVVACDACAQLDRRAEPHDALPPEHPTL